ncbi:MAG TPA: ABC transporter permease subunit [Bdellovibrionota bacterium]|nr:ABC transporter permease subunit [Bdellovibrionota bacterium]
MRVPPALGIASTLAIALFAALGLVLPLGALLTAASGWSGFLDSEALAVARTTTFQAALSTALSAAIGLPLGIWVGSLGPGQRERVVAWLRVPYGVPTVVAGTAWVAWLGREGWLAPLDLAYGFAAVVLAHVFFNAPWIAALVAEARASVPESLDDAARSLGASAWRRALHVHWPAVRASLAAASAQVFALCSMSFALVLILGGGPPVDTLETALYAKVRFGSLDLAGAIAFALWELLITLVPWALVLALTQPARVEPPAHARERRPAPRWASAAALAVALLFIVPYLSVFSSASLASDRLTGLWVPAWVSLRIALAAALGSVTLALAAIASSAFLSPRSRWAAGAIALLMALPAGISVLVLGMGLWLAYERWIDPFAGSLAAICALQILIFAPLAYRALWPVARGARRRLLEAAATLGAGPMRAFVAVEWPRWRGPIAGTAALVAGASLGEVAAVSLFYSESLVPLPLLVSRWMAQYRFDEARGLSAVLMVLSAGVMLFSARVSHGRA